MGRDRLLLLLERLPSHDVAALEHDRAITEDEVDSARDVAFAVELALGVGV